MVLKVEMDIYCYAEGNNAKVVARPESLRVCNSGERGIMLKSENCKVVL